MKYTIFFLLFITQLNFCFQDSLKIKSFEIFKSNEDTSLYVKIIYPQIIYPSNYKIQEKINETLKNQFLTSLGFYEDFSSDPENFSYHPSELRIYMETNFRIGYVGKEFISLILDHDEYTGGAHGNNHSIGLNFSLSDGELLKLSDFIKENQLRNLSLFCEQEILEIYKVESLEEVLFEDVINLTGEQDFYIKPNNLIIQFDPYEIGPYYLGSIEIELSFDRIKNLLKPGIKF
jgi:hypothetical protein